MSINLDVVMNLGQHTPSPWRDRFKASSIHLLVSLAIAAMAATLVFGIWYPFPYREISGGRELFLLLVSVDVILGPLITFSVFNRRKPMSELTRDLAIVVLLQVGALVYGLWTVSSARPVHLVFELDRFRVVHAVDVPPDLLPKTPNGIDPLPFTGPSLLAVRPFRNSKESMDATMAAMQGLQLAFRPDLWQPYEDAREQILKAAHPVQGLKTRFADHADMVDRALATVGARVEDAVYLPLVSRDRFWTVILDGSTARVVVTMPLDSF